jgi:hypothetical protein
VHDKIKNYNILQKNKRKQNPKRTISWYHESILNKKTSRKEKDEAEWKQPLFGKNWDLTNLMM